MFRPHRFCPARPRRKNSVPPLPNSRFKPLPYRKTGDYAGGMKARGYGGALLELCASYGGSGTPPNLRAEFLLCEVIGLNAFSVHRSLLLRTSSCRQSWSTPIGKKIELPNFLT